MGGDSAFETGEAYDWRVVTDRPTRGSASNKVVERAAHSTHQEQKIMQKEHEKTISANSSSEELTTLLAFLNELLDPDVFGYMCSDEVKDKARLLLGLPSTID